MIEHEYLEFIVLTTPIRGLASGTIVIDGEDVLTQEEMWCAWKLDMASNSLDAIDKQGHMYADNTSYAKGVFVFKLGNIYRAVPEGNFTSKVWVDSEWVAVVIGNDLAIGDDEEIYNA